MVMQGLNSNEEMKGRTGALVLGKARGDRGDDLIMQKQVGDVGPPRPRVS